jgi:hypothetical protein
VAAVALSVGLTLLFGTVFPATNQLSLRAQDGASAHPQPPSPHRPTTAPAAGMTASATR